MKKAKKIIGVIVIIWVFSILLVLGAMGGKGPFKFIFENKMKKMPGNTEKYHLENVETLSDSPLKGKNLLFLGSSVTYGSNSLGVSMADYIGKIDGCNVVKEAVSGTTLAASRKNSYVERLLKIDKNQQFDAIVVQLSTNDATQKIELGDISSSGSIDDFDTNTVLGAIEYIIAYCQDTWNCPVIFYTGTKYDSKNYEAMVDALQKIQEKWGIEIIDLWNDAEMNAVSEEDYALYMANEIHPTQAGYLLWWTPKFQKILYKTVDET